MEKIILPVHRITPHLRLNHLSGELFVVVSGYVATAAGCEFAPDACKGAVVAAAVPYSAGGLSGCTVNSRAAHLDNGAHFGVLPGGFHLVIQRGTKAKSDQGC